MAERNYRLHDGKSGSAVTVNVIPRASRNEISEILDDGTIKIRLTAPASEGKSNQALLDFLASVLKVKTSDLEIISGLSGNAKLVAIANMDSADVQEKILQNLS
jgi:uncharacterized protein (TIGR00251 family)